MEVSPAYFHAFTAVTEEATKPCICSERNPAAMLWCQGWCWSGEKEPLQIPMVLEGLKDSAFPRI